LPHEAVRVELSVLADGSRLMKVSGQALESILEEKTEGKDK
jgi:hypothetical protein